MILLNDIWEFFVHLLGNSQRRNARQPIRVELLESRQLLTAANPATPAITGTVFMDFNANGTVDSGEEVSGATVQLYQDVDGNGNFDDTVDTQFGSDVITGASGDYCFDNLEVGESYFVVQLAQTVGNSVLSLQVNGAVEPAAPNLRIDEFVTTQVVSADPPAISSGQSTETSTIPPDDIIGGERDVFTNLLAGTSAVSIDINEFGLRDTLQYNADVGVTGNATISWDGVDGDASLLAAGLTGTDLTNSNENTGISLLIGAQEANSFATVRLVQGAGISSASFEIPQTSGGVAESYQFLSFANDFVGSVNPNNVDAIQLFLDSELSDANNIELDVIGANGPRVLDFANQPVVDLAVTKTDGQDTAVPGESITYTITVQNNGPMDVTAATVIDMFPVELENVNYTSIANNGASGNTTSGNSFINDTVDMPADSSIIYTVTGTIASDATGTVENAATVGVPNTFNETDGSNNFTIDQDELTPQVDLSVVKDDSLTTIIPGDSVTYTIVVTNAGPSDVVDATIVDQFPAELTNVTYTSAVTGTVVGNTASGSGNILDVVSMRANSSITYTVTGQLADDAIGQLTNTASVNAPNTVVDTDSTNDSSTDIDDINVRADLEISKTDGITTIRPGANLMYTVVARNNGPSTVTDARIVDSFPSVLTNISYTSSSMGGATGNSSGVDNIDETVHMPPGSEITYTISATVANDATGTLSNTATITAPAGVDDFDATNNSALDEDSIVPEFDLVVSKTDGQSVAAPGETITYTIVVSNNGPNDVVNATIQDNFPATFLNPQFTSSSSGGATGNTVGVGDINDTVSLPANSSVTYTVSGTIDSSATGTITNSATATAPAGLTEADTGNNTATDTDTLTPAFDLEVIKSNSTTSVLAGEPVTYTIEVLNNGPSDAAGVSVVDNFPSALENVSFTSVAQNGAAGNTLMGTDSINDTVDLPNGSSITYTVNATVDNSATGTITNVATVTGPTGETNSTNNSSTDSDEIRLILRQISGSVYVDSNQNGVRDNSESPIANVELTLTGTDRTGASVNQTTLTDPNGDFLFADLLPGTYAVQETQPAGFEDGQESAGTGALGNPTVADDIFSNIILGNDDDAVDFDFGEILVRPSKRDLLASNLGT